MKVFLGEACWNHGGRDYDYLLGCCDGWHCVGVDEVDGVGETVDEVDGVVDVGGGVVSDDAGLVQVGAGC